MLNRLVLALPLLFAVNNVFAETPDQTPDSLYLECIDTSDRVLFRAMRNLCDELATDNQIRNSS